MVLTALLLILVSTFLHAAWNLLAHTSAESGAFLRRLLISMILLGAIPAAAGQILGTPFPATTWGLLIVAGIFQALYWLGLSMGYRHGEFTVVYPMARAIPILLLAVADVIRGREPAPLGWMGIALVSIGSLIVPLSSLRKPTLGHYWNRTIFWVVVTAMGTVGYTIADKIALELLPRGPVSAARYVALEFIIGGLFFLPIWRLFGMRDRGAAPINWHRPVLGAVLAMTAYGLVLWAYQLIDQASYVVAARQFSVVVGVVLAAFLLHEPARVLRLAAALVIMAGIACIILAGG
jgi:drug/metabolite transporter (DMT)-like permease